MSTKPPLPVFLKTDNALINSAFRVAIGDLTGNIQPFQDGLLDTPRPCVLAGLEYDTPWTRDAAINVWNGVGLLFPTVARDTLLSVLEKRAEQVFIGGQYWDAIIWTTGAWAYYLYTGDRDLLALALDATRSSLAHFEESEYNAASGLFRGPACYGDGVAAYPDIYARTNGSSSILEWPKHNPQDTAETGYGIPMQALSTNCLYYNAYRLLGEIAAELGRPADPAWETKAQVLKDAINRQFWDDKRGQYNYLVDRWGGSDHQEGLGSAFAILFGVADQKRTRQVVRSQHITPHCIPCVWPSYARYRRTQQDYGRHSGTVWPHVQGFWAEAALRAGSPEKFAFELFKLAELAARDGMFAEIYHPETGEVYGGLQEGAPGWQWHSCRRQTWSATAFLRMVLTGLLGMDFSTRGIAFHPTLPEGITRLELHNLPYRGGMLHLSLTGSGSRVTGCSINDRDGTSPFLPAGIEGEVSVALRVSP